MTARHVRRRLTSSGSSTAVPAARTSTTSPSNCRTNPKRRATSSRTTRGRSCAGPRTREQQRVSSHEVAADRLTVINGGAVRVEKKKAAKADDEEEEIYGRVELWVGPKDKPPVKHVEEDSTLKEAVFVGGNDFMDEEKEVADWMLKNLSEMMRGDKNSVGCIVVYPGDGTGVWDGDGETKRPAPDVFKMAEGWKAELVKKHGFDAERVVVLNGPREDSGSGKLEVWAVPYGAPLPDPFKSADEAVGGTDEEQAEDGGDAQAPPPTGR